MSHFYADIQGNRGQATRGGSKSSGIDGHIRGWDIGCSVVIRYNEQTEKDEMTIYLTSGSNGHTEKELGTFQEVGYAKCPKKLRR